jgi:hypothetical protein|tara:strand:- start:370 stop:2247 length:1878 start_codon:yes stop_codon:yes gene_type:complete
MPLTKFNFKPGINKEETDYSNEGGWVDGDKIRFRKGRVEKIGGWEKSSSNTYIGTGRALHSWVSLGGSRYLGLGTTNKYYIESGGNFNDITPIRATTTNGITFAATDGSAIITATDSDHGAVVGDFVTIAGSASLGGNITAAVLNQEHQITGVPTANTYTFTASATANASDSGNGGSGVDGVYQINSGLDFYVAASGWGSGAWSAGTWGSATAITAAGQLRLWTHDNYGENLIINPRGGGIFRWVEDNGLSTRALALSGISGASLVPTKGLQVITSETDRHLIVLGADPISSGSRTGTIDPMLVAFSDQENELDFQPLATNTAGSVRLSSGSFIIGGLKSRQEVLIWTDTSLYSMTFIGPPLTFAINLINEGAGLIGPKGAVNAPNGVYFMSKNAFYFYNGSVQKLPCSVQDYVFADLDLDQAFKCFATLNSAFSEVWFFYPSIEDNTREISRYVIYNYEENSWSIGSLIRYAWLDTGIEDKPLATAKVSSSNFLYQHETGFNDDLSSMDGVFIESADLDVADGDSFAFVKKLLPDIKFSKAVGTDPTPAMNIVVKSRNFANQSLTTDSTTQVTESSTFASLRTRSRQVVLRFESDDDNTVDSNKKDYKWRLGSTRLDVVPSGRR